VAEDVARPYGTWSSPITAQVVASQGLRVSALAVDDGDVYWVEGRPADGGRSVLVRRGADGLISDVTAAPMNVRTRVHEYGGRAYVADRGEIVFSNFSDQRLYRANGDPVTPAGDWFYADPIVDRSRRRLICVREDHSDPSREPLNAIVAIPLVGEPAAGDVLASGYDFYSTPRLSPDETRLSWISWRHPRMPWDGTELWVADVNTAGALERPRRVAGGDVESIYQPGWTPDGSLVFASDRDGWWRLYELVDPRQSGDAATIRAVLDTPPPEAEFGRPEWVFGTATWVPAGIGRLVVAYTSRGVWRLGIVDTRARTLRDVPIDLQPRDWLVATATHAFAVCASPTRADTVVAIDLDRGSYETLRATSTFAVDPADISLPHAIEFPTSRERTAHAFYYPPRNRAESAAADERPPLIAISHGGPTASAHPTLNLAIQFWTTRGFAVVDVNYGGSTGYGRAYRERLNGEWGIVDVGDVVNAAKHLVAEHKADPNRLIIRGGSAGGYTTLAALTFHPDVFKAGASYYGVSDLEVLARDTHKFESRYLDTLVGPYPESADVYRARSPIHYVDRLSCALILLQGLEDKVVPPNQSETMAAAVREKGWPVAYLAFEGEQHGFRKAETIVRSLEAELFFYGAVFGFTPADSIEPLTIDNLARTPV
jgi:dipeptidyl aminopeptidase/acylaminoacyl peptidase